MNPTAMQILRAALEEIAKDAVAAWNAGYLPTTLVYNKARAALEAADKAPRLADDGACWDAWRDVFLRHFNNKNTTGFTGALNGFVECLRAIDAYQRGRAKP